MQEKSARCGDDMEQKRETILEWYRKNHKEIDEPCGGRGECGRCKVRFLSNAPEASEQEKKRLTEEEIIKTMSANVKLGNHIFYNVIYFFIKFMLK